jgi:hypothetical protein
MGSPATPTYNSLSLRQKWRVVRWLRRGRAPDDPRLAKATAEFGEEWEASHSRRIRIFTAVVGPIAAAAGIWAALDGDTLGTIVQGSFVLVLVINALISPAFWPRRVSRSVKESRELVASQR